MKISEKKAKKFQLTIPKHCDNSMSISRIVCTYTVILTLDSSVINIISVYCNNFEISHYGFSKKIRLWRLKTCKNEILIDGLKL